MKFLYIEKDINVRDIYVMKLQAEFNAEIIEVDDSKQAIAQLEDDQDFAFILSDFDVAQSKGGKLYEHLTKNRIKVPYVILGNEEIEKHQEFKTFHSDHRGNRQINTPIEPDKFKDLLINVIKLSGHSKNFEDASTDEYRNVRIRNFTRFSQVPVDIFIRLSQEKFVKVLHQDAMYPSDILNKYMEKGVEYLYVKSDEYKTLADHSVQRILSLYDKKSLTRGQKEAIQMMALEDIHRDVQEFGLSEETLEVTKKTMETSVAMAKKSPSIWSLLKKMKVEGDYIYKHSMKLSYILTAIAKKTDWNSDATCYKLSLAAMMHDMTLPSNELAKIQTLAELEKSNFSDEEKEKYKRHTIEASELVQKNKDLPRDVHFVIAQHHERPDGTGFPRGLSKLRIAPLAAIFIIGHEFLHHIEKFGGEMSDANRDAAIEELKKVFSVGNFKKPLDALIEVFAEKKNKNFGGVRLA